MTVKKRQITTYDFDGIFDGYCVDVETGIDNKDMLNFHIYHKDCGIKDYMFGVYKKQLRQKGLTVEDIISGNIEQSIKLYERMLEKLEQE